MVYRSSVFFTSDDLDPKIANRDNVHYAVCARLPFRFRTGELYRFKVTDDSPFEIWVHNRFSIPEGADYSDWRKQFDHGGRDGWSRLWSDVVVYIPDPDLDDEALQGIRQKNVGIPGEKNLFRAMTALNYFICAYATGTDQLFGGSPLRMLTDMEFFDSLYLELTILSPPNSEMTTMDIERMLNWSPQTELVSTGARSMKTTHGANPLAVLAGV